MRAGNLDAIAEKMEQVAGTESILPDRLQKSIVNGDEMTPAHRLAISEGAEKVRDADFRRTIRRAKPHGYTQNGLARALKISPALLSLYRNGKRPAPADIREKVERLTGWGAAHWRKIT